MPSTLHRRIESLSLGQALTFLRTAEETGGELLEMEAVMRPGAGTPPHVHLLQEERFEILDGSASFRVGRRRLTCSAGDTLAVKPRVAHRFRNESDADVRLRVELRPALDTEALFRSLYALDRDGRVNRLGAPNPLRTAVFAQGFGDSFFWLAGVPVGVQRAAFAPLAPLGRALGYGDSYP